MSAWTDQMFPAQQARKGGIIRRDLEDVLKFSSREEILAIAKNKNYHVIESGNQIVVLCNDGDLKILC